MQIKSTSIEMVEADSIVENPKNRNQHPKEQIERLEKLIRFQGFRNPLVISKRTGFLVAGHGRLEAAKNLGIKEVPVTRQDFENEAQEYAYVISDNEIARWSELDKTSVLSDIEEIDLDIELLGVKDNFEVKKINPEDLSDKNKEIDTDNFGNDLEDRKSVV